MAPIDTVAWPIYDTNYQLTPIVAQYLLIGSLPPEGTVCSQDWVPFSTPLLASSTAAGGKPQIRPAMVIDAVREAAR